MACREQQAAELFTKIDTNVLRAAGLAPTQPPPGYTEPAIEDDEQMAECYETPFTCDRTFQQDGCEHTCGKKFRTYRALATHIRKTHDEFLNYYLNTDTNQCPLCMRVFADQRVAAKHVRQACSGGTCRTCGARWLWLLKTPTSLKCPTCEFKPMS